MSIFSGGLWDLLFPETSNNLRGGTGVGVGGLAPRAIKKAYPGGYATHALMFYGADLLIWLEDGISKRFLTSGVVYL